MKIDFSTRLIKGQSKRFSMPIRMQKVEIGVKQLETAIDMYIDKKDYISAITLAGAAEEVLGKLAERKGHKTAKKDLSDALLKKVPSVSEKELSDKHLNRGYNSICRANFPQR